MTFSNATNAPRRIGVMAGVLTAAISLFSCCFLFPRPHNMAAGHEMPVTTTLSALSLPAHAAVPLPPPPAITQPRQRAAGTVPDPFAGGPAPVPPKVIVVIPRDPPPQITLCMLPAVIPYRHGITVAPPRQLVLPRTPIGRYAGLISHESGQVAALFEDRDGMQYVVRTGDALAGYSVQAISPEALVLRDYDGHEHILPLTGVSRTQFE